MPDIANKFRANPDTCRHWVPHRLWRAGKSDPAWECGSCTTVLGRRLPFGRRLSDYEYDIDYNVYVYTRGGK